MLFANGIGPVLCFSPAHAGFGFRRHRGGERGFCRFDHALPGFDFAASGRKFALDRLQPPAFGEPPRCSGRGVRGDGKTVPAPKIAVARHQPLAWLERCSEAGSGGAFDDADLGQPAGQFRRGFYKKRQRLCAFRQHRIGRIERRAGPAHRCGGIDRRIEIVAESGAERLLVTLGDVQRVGHRRPQVLVLDRKQLADRLGFGLEPLHAAFGGCERSAGGVEFGSRLRVRNLCRSRGALRFGEFCLRGREHRSQSGKIGLAAAGRGKAGVDVCKLGFQPFRALRVIVQRRLKLIALRRQIGECPGRTRQTIFPIWQGLPRLVPGDR